MTPDIQFEALTEDTLLLRFGDRIDMAINSRVHAAARCLQRRLPELECVPAYASLALRFDPSRWSDDDGTAPHEQLQAAVCAVLDVPGEVETAVHEVSIPVCYGGEYGPDLGIVAHFCRLDAEAVIALHAAGAYRVAMLGFAPGFPYLLGLDARLAVRRRTDPRQQVAAGSVAIGGNQTGIYPATLPGGWHVIGRTPSRLFDIAARQPSLLVAGDRVRFQAIDETAFRHLAAASRA